ncbi:uncharacterized protein LOC144918704 [Branchiostoma floridae x Branchiostoma belcheri]
MEEFTSVPLTLFASLNNISYDEHHLAGDAALQDGKLEAAEQHFASALYQVHDRESPRQREEEECLRKLGAVYVRRGEQTKDGQDFAKATALYNAALARNGDRQLLIDSIKETERLFLYHTVGIDCKPAPYETDIQHKTRLEKYRAEVKVRLDTIHKDHNPYQYDEDDPLVKEVEKKRAESVRGLFRDIARQRKDFIKDLVEECIKTIRPPPCQYAMVGLGSQATELVTPYSDLEFAILVEENKDSPENKKYFLNLTCYLYLKIINLGETILPAVAIKSLDDFYSGFFGDSWFYDSVTPRGFAFDGAMPWASKTPLGREKTEKKPAVSLIQTPTGMAEFQQYDIALAHGYHLSSTLRNVSYLAGDQTLVEEYMARVIQELNTLDKNGEAPVAGKFAWFSLLHTLLEHRDQEPTDRPLDVKKRIYRFPTVAVMNLGLLGGVYAASVWDTIKEMEEAGVVSKENAHHLLVLVSISGELRLRTYLELGGQKENFSSLLGMQKQQDGNGDTQQEGGGEAVLKPVFHVPDQKMLNRYYYTAIPLKTYFNGLKIGRTAEFMATLPERRAFYDASPRVKAAICTKLLQFKEVLSHTEEALKALEEGKDAGPWIYGPMGSLDLKASLLGQQAESYSRLGDHRKAISCWEEQLKIQQQLHRPGSSHEEMGYTYSHIMMAWLELHIAGHSMDFEKVVTFGKYVQLEFNKDIDAGHLNPDHELLTALSEQFSILNNVELMIRNPTIQPTIDPASCLMRNGEKMLNLVKLFDRGHSVYPDIAKLLQCLVRLCNMVQGDYAKAITYTMESLKIMKITYGQDTAHPDIVAALTDAGDSLCGLDDHVGAVRFYEEALEMNTVVYRNGSPHPDTANILTKLGSVFRKAGEYTKSVGYYERTLEVNKAIHGQDAAHTSIAESLSKLAAVYEDLKDHTKANQLYEEALNMLKVIHGGNETHGDEARHPDIVRALRRLECLWSDVGDNEKARAFCEQALKMNQELYGPTTPNHTTAILLGNMGAYLEKSGDNQIIINFHEEALKMLEEVLGKNKQHPDIARVLGNLGSAYREAAEYTKSLRYYERTLEVNKAIHGQDAAHTSIAESLSNLAEVYGDLKDHTKANQLYEEALNMFKVIHGGNEAHGDEARHPDIVRALRNLACLWYNMGDNEKCLAFSEQDLKMNQQLYGQTTPHYDTAIALGNMGLCLEKSGDNFKAISVYEQALSMLEEVLEKSKEDSDMAWLLSSLGSACRKAGEYKKYLLYYERTLEMNKAIHGQDAAHSSIAESLSDLAEGHGDLGNRRKAIQLYEDALNMLKVIYGGNGIHGGEEPRHPDIARVLNNLGDCWRIVGDNEKARAFFEQSLKMCQELHGPTTPNHNTAISLGNMGKVLQKSGDYPKAISFYEEALVMLEEVLGKNTEHPHIAWLLGDLGSAYHKTGEDTKSLQYCERAMGMIENFQGQDSAYPVIAHTLRNIATVYEDFGDHTKAIQLYQDALHRVQTVQGDNKTHPDILKLLNNLETVYNKAGDHEKANSYRDQAHALKKATGEEETPRWDTDSTEETPRKDTGSPEETPHTD